MSIKRIPRTDSIEELAHFWDTHDVTDFEDELEEVSEPVFQRDTIVKVQLSSEDVETVEGIARSRGIPVSDLIRAWVLEKVQASP